jgi:hypothetical protein
VQLIAWSRLRAAVDSLNGGGSGTELLPRYDDDLREMPIVIGEEFERVQRVLIRRALVHELIVILLGIGGLGGGLGELRVGRQGVDVE